MTQVKCTLIDKTIRIQIMIQTSNVFETLIDCIKIQANLISVLSGQTVQGLACHGPKAEWDANATSLNWQLDQVQPATKQLLRVKLSLEEDLNTHGQEVNVPLDLRVRLYCRNVLFSAIQFDLTTPFQAQKRARASCRCSTVAREP